MLIEIVLDSEQNLFYRHCFTVIANKTNKFSTNAALSSNQCVIKTPYSLLKKHHPLHSKTIRLKDVPEGSGPVFKKGKKMKKKSYNVILFCHEVVGRRGTKGSPV